jgi:Holliday junction resolvase
VVALYLKSLGWKVALSRGSRGPADIIATYGNTYWFIQVKSSAGVPRIRGYEIKRLKEIAACKGGLPVVSTLQPFHSGFSIGNYSILFYMLDNWQALDPMSPLEN